MSRGLAGAALVAGAVAAVSSCSGLFGGDDCGRISCGACPPALTVTVEPQDGTPLTSVTSSDDRVSCVEDAARARWVCTSNEDLGAYDFTVSAPGYQPRQVDGQIEPDDDDGCCSCGYVPQNVAVRLTPT